MTQRGTVPSPGPGGTRDLVVAVVGPEALAARFRRPGVRLVAMSDPERFDALQGYVAPDSIDACVVARVPWPRCDGLELARALRGRLIGTLLVLDSADDGRILQERLTVVPVGGVLRATDLDAGLMVAVHETWFMTCMTEAVRSKAEPTDPWDADEPTAPQPTNSAHAPAQGRLEAPPIPAPTAAQVAPTPRWMGLQTREVEVDEAVLARLAMDLPVPGSTPPLSKRAPPPSRTESVSQPLVVPMEEAGPSPRWAVMAALLAVAVGFATWRMLL